MRPFLALSAAGLLLLAGCASDPPSPLPGNGASGGTHALAGGAAPFLARWNYTTPDGGGLPFTKAYAGSLTPAEVSGLHGGLPLGLSPPEFATCCYMDWVEAPGLLAVDQLAAVRVTVSWTNTETDRAGLDAAVCLPWACTAFNFGPDESQAPGRHSDTLTLITSGRQDWLDAGLPYLLGVRYTNAAVANGLAYDVSVEAVPVGNGLAPLDAHMVHVPAGANVTAELVGAFEREVSAGLMVYGPDDRPLRWVELRGAPGERVRVPLPAGTPVVVPFAADGGFVRLFVDREPEMQAAHRLRVEVGEKVLAEVADGQAQEGDVTYQAPAGMMDDFPFFLYTDGVAAQNAFGLEPTPLGGARITLSSSQGLVAALDRTLLGLYTSTTGMTCLNCNANGEWNPENYVDDDGTYQVHWESSGAAGRFVLFTRSFVR